MTYGLFLLIFLICPIIFLAVALRRQITRAHLLSGAIICAISFFYTTPWDNYAAYKKLWTFAPEFVWGPPLWFGYLPLEEYLFYFAEAIFVCLVVAGLSRVPGLIAEESHAKTQRRKDKTQKEVVHCLALFLCVFASLRGIPQLPPAQGNE